MCLLPIKVKKNVSRLVHGQPQWRTYLFEGDGENSGLAFNDTEQ